MFLERFSDWHSPRHVLLDTVISFDQFWHQSKYVVEESLRNPNDTLKRVTKDDIALNHPIVSGK